MLKKVLVSSEVWNACWNHALTTSTEEIMGLLIGSLYGEDVLKLTTLRISRRITKQKDRVEIDHGDMIEASEFAESLPGNMRVLGWYHSHPRITVNPSHVDLATQANYQMMDRNFVGLIFSVFSYDVNRNKDLKEAIAFQSFHGECKYLEIEIEDDQSLEGLPGFDAVARLPEILKQEELTTLSVCEESDPLAIVHNRGCLLGQLSNQTAIVTIPLLEAAQSRRHFLLKQNAVLKLKKDKLIKELDD